MARARSAFRAGMLAALLAWLAGAPARGTGDDLARHFVTAPENLPERQLLVDVRLNGVPSGPLAILVSARGIALPGATARALGLADPAGGTLALAPDAGFAARLDEARGTLALDVPAARLGGRRFAPDADAAPVLSPESWGAYVDYDLNARRNLAGPGGGPGGTQWGGVASLQLLAPDLVGGFGWAYDSTRPGRDALVRLDSTLTWRPQDLSVAVSLGDVISDGTPTFAQARVYRFGGVRAGTDFSGVPGWSGAPIASVTGTAQAQSAIDVYLDGQRTFHGDTPGGPFSLALPPGATGGGTSVVVTDVTGRSVVIPVEVARADAQLLRRGLFLWSAGVGAPRLDYGAADSRYGPKTYGYGHARYGAGDRVTATAHAEGGAGLAEAEFGADLSVTPALAAHAMIAASHSGRGSGAAARLGVAFAGPWGMGFDAAVAHTFGRFDDVVSVSARGGARTRGPAPLAGLYGLPARSEISARVYWQARGVTVSASYQADTYPGSPAAGFAALSVNTLVAGRIPVFANLSRAMSGDRATTILAGVTLSFGAVSASASGGYGTGGGAYGGGPTGTLAASRPLGEGAGDYGWDAYASRSPAGTFANGSAQLRTGYGIPGVAVQSFGGRTTGIATLRGSAGVVARHPFLADPAPGGLIIADAGLPGVPVQLNGYDKGFTGADGRMAIAGAVPGVPQRVAIDTGRMPIEAIPEETDRLVTVRERGAAVAGFGVRSAARSAQFAIRVGSAPPPVGSVVSSRSASAPVSKEGRAYLLSLDPGEVLTLAMPDGTSCRIRTGFDGRGGVGRHLGVLACGA